jgi:RNA polymerase sigma-B factor
MPRPAHAGGTEADICGHSAYSSKTGDFSRDGLDLAFAFGTLRAGAVLTVPDLLGLTGLDDRELLAIIRSLPQISERRAAACELLVARYRALVWSCALRYRSSSDSPDDLLQVGYVGLMKAINNFDLSLGCSLAAYAEPCITGEVKRHFRDRRWHIHVTRTVKDMAAEIRAATPKLAQELGRTPSGPDLVRHLRISTNELRDAQLAELAFLPSSLDAPLSASPGSGTLADVVGADDPRIEHILSMQSVATHWRELSACEQKILLLRFYSGLTQVQIGQQLGMSPMQVARRLAHALAYLRPRLLGR